MSNSCTPTSCTCQSVYDRSLQMVQDAIDLDDFSTFFPETVQSDTNAEA